MDIEIRLPTGETYKIDILYLADLVRRGTIDAQTGLLYWETRGRRARKAADASRKLCNLGEELQEFLAPHLYTDDLDNRPRTVL